MKPLRFAMWIALISGFAAIVFLTLIIVSKFVNPNQIETGYASLATMILFGFAIQMFCLGIFGEYISKIVEESRKRPRYIIGEINEK
jgi:multisubunit Na+/H+ antiporter MnhB subunit